MTEEITAGLMDLVNNAVPTAWCYYSDMAKKFDEEYGDGWSKEHPDVVAKMASVAARDFHTMLLCQNLQKLSAEHTAAMGDISEQLNYISENIE